MPVIDEKDLQNWLLSAGTATPGAESKALRGELPRKRFRRVSVRDHIADCPCGKPHLEVVSLEGIVRESPENM